ncbi:NAD(P)-dependent dehydrogenase (short-subunit alcohol dehydrogenase family) [Stackebrandtia endophytica]|uniref:NAD(P)-dependent dehydrogenase (Short-subunit alcohol dehydrogenase family) n=1 Tax=Stackebrandtia endophytica TaxID=1496996 RepID=A0A543AUZ1_9ACTN|nr:SDR family oxidoreductase [Stackebrandtia endophytica]TQL76399.1 NAD(P)-dependent dehydrogenase (short-subunit alcohol dehydrogenase family) [Stackebrandtia endophytica]
MRTALVTGGSRGIGRAISVALARNEVSVIGLHYRSDEQAVKETVRLVEAVGATAIPIAANLDDDPVTTATGLADRFLDAVEERTGERALDILVNNAGVTHPQSLGEIDETTYRKVVDLNLTAPLFLLQHLEPHLRDHGRVINISTGMTRIAAPTHPVYAVAKSALNGLGLALAPTLGARGITINAVMPGITQTDMTGDWLDQPGVRDWAEGESVFNRVGQPDDIAELVAYLASPQARWTTGQTIDATGGSRL